MADAKAAALAWARLRGQHSGLSVPALACGGWSKECMRGRVGQLRLRQETGSGLLLGGTVR